MALHFPVAELQNRIDIATKVLRDRGLAGLLVFKQESLYWLTGYDTAGYSQFQCMWLGADKRTMLLTRSSDVRQARLTSTVEDVRLWVDTAGATPATTLRAQLTAFIPPGARVGVEYFSATLNAHRGRQLDAAFADVALEDVSTMIDELRVVKSATELDYVREAGRIADNAWHRALQACKPGGSEADMLAAIYAEILGAGGDPAAGRFVCGAGDNALLCRYFTGKGTIGASDQVNVEFAAAYRHYHAALMRTIVVGEPSTLQLDMHDATVEAMTACRAAMRPGRTFGDLFDAHARVFDARGYGRARLNACGYSLGAAYPPTWMDWPMAFTGNAVTLAPSMVVFLHMILLDDETGLAMCLGETFIVTEGEPERLSMLEYDLPLVAVPAPA